MDPNMHRNLFPIWHFARTYMYHHNSKNTSCISIVLHIERLLYHMRCLFSMLEVDARYDWQVMAPNTHHNAFLISHYAYLHSKLEKYRSYMDVLHIEWLFFSWRNSLLVWFGVAWEFRLESYSPTHALVVLWYKIVCIMQAHIHITIWCTAIHKNKIQIPYLCTPHTEWRFYCQQWINLREQYQLATLHIAVSFELLV